jgi:hypothetical protein
MAPQVSQLAREQLPLRYSYVLTTQTGHLIRKVNHQFSLLLAGGFAT